jgi:Helicase conserved C-terminal domain
MPTLAESLQGRDLGHLRIIAELWGIKLDEQDIHAALLQLTRSLINLSAFNELLSGFPEETRKALTDLVQHSGRVLWAKFTRMYGEVREMGTAKRDRDRPYENPVSVTEMLWYRGLVARAFFDTSKGPEEFAYMPDDLLNLMPGSSPSDGQIPGRPASSTEYARVAPASDHLLDHACTMLAALRLGSELPESWTMPIGEVLTSTFMKLLLSTAGFLNEAGTPLPEPVRIFLEAERGEALFKLYQAWKRSTHLNELLLLPGLAFEGNWTNEPLRTRQFILESIAAVPAGKWWNLEAFIFAIKQRTPDFQRPAGDYDSWFVRDRSSGNFLRGFEYWDRVDGRLIHYMLTGPLHWLGVLDLAQPEEAEEATAFRLSRWSGALLNEKQPKGFAVEAEALLARSDLRISAKRLVSRRVRYQAARFCDWEKETPDEYRYRITPASLARAQKQGLTVSQLLTLLNRYAKAVPPNLIKALERWDKQGNEFRLEKMLVLRVASEDILQVLRKSRASRFIGEPLGPTTVAIKPGAVEKVLSALAEAGYLGEVREDLD